VELRQDNSQAADRLPDLRAKSAESLMEARVANLLPAVQRLISMDRIAEAYELTRNALPDTRIVVERYITFHSLRSTSNATANAAIQVIAAAAANDRRRIHGQIDLKGEVAVFTEYAEYRSRSEWMAGVPNRSTAESGGDSRNSEIYAIH
jgi:hypothetical protein